MLSLQLDMRTGIIHTVVTGAYDRRDTELYLRDLADTLAFSRSKWGRARHVVDARQAELHGDGDYHCISGASIELYGPEDRTAAVMCCERAIARVGEMPSHFRTATFGTPEEAVAWLRSGSMGELELL